MAVFPLFGHYFDHLVCLPHTSLPTFTPIASLTGFSALQSILRLLPTFISHPLANHFIYLAHFSVYLFSLFFQSIYSVNFLATFPILWVSYLTCLHQLLCLLSTLLVFQPFIYGINFHTPNHKALTQGRR